MTTKEYNDLAEELGKEFATASMAVAKLRKKLEEVNDKLNAEAGINWREARYGTFFRKAPSAVQVYAIIHLLQALDKVREAEGSLGGNEGGAQAEAVSATCALFNAAMMEEAKAAAEEVRNA